MKLSEAWLREWVSPKKNTNELVHLLTMAGLEVDGVELAAPEFSGVVIGEIVEVTAHPDAEKLRVCSVNDGTQVFQVVCGAANAAVGLRIPFAKVGATLPGGMTIKQAKLRGVESQGMLCGASELGLEDLVDGLLELPIDAPLGEDFRQFLDLDDAIIEVDLTPNRGDCLSVQGVAREVGVLTATDVSAPVVEAVECTISDKLTVELSFPEYCPIYAGRIIRNVNLDVETPLWMREKLRRADLRSIDPIVDVTNYVMMELGQPLHAFDLDMIAGSKLTIREANQAEKLILLDSKEVELEAGTLVIADDEKGLALGGIMGGLSSSVTSNTKNIFLESAFFEPAMHAGQARKLGMHTDASHRFERGVDVGLQRRAIERATRLLLDIVGGEAGPVELVSQPRIQNASKESVEATESGVTKVLLRENQIKRVLGFAIPGERVDDMLSRLDFNPERSNDGWMVTVPSHRFDIAIEADLLEELARIYGYDLLPVEPPEAQLTFSEVKEGNTPTQNFRSHLVARGYHEAITYSFIDEELNQLFSNDVDPIKLVNPIASDMAVMRCSLLPGLIKTARYNINRQQPRLKLFEMGLGFSLAEQAAKSDKHSTSVDQLLEQRPLFAGLLYGSKTPESWLSTSASSKGQDSAFDFYDVKGDVESLLALGMGVKLHSELVFSPLSEGAAAPYLHPGQSAAIIDSDQQIGVLGLLHPELQQTLDIEVDIWLFELQLNLISEKKVPEFKELSKFPEVRRDLAIIVDCDVNAGEVIACAQKAAGKELTGIVVFDQYSGPGIDDDKQSIGLGLTWQHIERTLSEDEINALVSSVMSSLQTRFNASLR